MAVADIERSSRRREKPVTARDEVFKDRIATKKATISKAETAKAKDRLTPQQRTEVEGALERYYKDAIPNGVTPERVDALKSRKREMLEIIVQSPHYSEENEEGKELFLRSVMLLHDMAVEGVRYSAPKTFGISDGIRELVRQNVGTPDEAFFLKIDPDRNGWISTQNAGVTLWESGYKNCGGLIGEFIEFSRLRGYDSPTSIKDPSIEYFTVQDFKDYLSGVRTLRPLEPVSAQTRAVAANTLAMLLGGTVGLDLFKSTTTVQGYFENDSNPNSSIIKIQQISDDDLLRVVITHEVGHAVLDLSAKLYNGNTLATETSHDYGPGSVYSSFHELYAYYAEDFVDGNADAVRSRLDLFQTPPENKQTSYYDTCARYQVDPDFRAMIDTMKAKWEAKEFTTYDQLYDYMKSKYPERFEGIEGYADMTKPTYYHPVLQAQMHQAVPDLYPSGLVAGMVDASRPAYVTYLNQPATYNGQPVTILRTDYDPAWTWGSMLGSGPTYIIEHADGRQETIWQEDKALVRP